MVDINRYADETLAKTGYNICYQYPEKTNTFPVVCYYTLSERDVFAADNVPVIQRGYVQIDIYSRERTDGGAMGIVINDAMEADDWHRELSLDCPKEDGIYHRTMRYSRNFII